MPKRWQKQQEQEYSAIIIPMVPYTVILQQECRCAEFTIIL